MTNGEVRSKSKAKHDEHKGLTKDTKMEKAAMEKIDGTMGEMKAAWERERQIRVAVAREVHSLVVDIPYARLDGRRQPAATDPAQRLAELELLDALAPPANRPEGRVAMELRTTGESGRV